MMTWEAFQLTFRLQSPLHSGHGKIGNIQKTRLYVTSRMLWGALTARITRLQRGSDYARIGKLTKGYLRTSYFFPCLDENGERPILPWVEHYQLEYQINGLPFKVEASIVERLILTSYTSTAISVNTLTAEEGSLHEVELISDRYLIDFSEGDIKVRAGDPVYLSGVFFIATDAPREIKEHWRKALTQVQVGGERSYGFGQMTLIGEPHLTNSLFGYSLNLCQEHPEVTVKKDEPLLAHVRVEEESDLKGIVEPFLGRETLNDGRFGTNLSKAEVCWMPGSTAAETKVFCVKETGLWQKRT